MNESKISVRYAKSIYEFAVEKNQLEAVKNDIELLSQSIEQVEDFDILIESPLLKESDKKKAFKAIFEKNISQATLSFIELVITNKREIYLKDIFRNFMDIYRKKQGIKKAVLTSAIELDKRITEKLQSLLTDNLKSKIEMTQEIDQDIIGGFILRIEDQQIDSSVVKQLKLIKQSLQESNMLKKG